MRYLILISLLILVSPFLIIHADAANWYNSSWLKARQVNVTHADISADLTNYPVYINLTAVNIGTDAQADCDDFVFVDYYNVTVLNHEIETCDSTNDWAEFWVNVPTVFTANDTAIFLYYNNAAASNQQHTQETWNSNFKFVFHLNNTFIDSTTSPTTCTNSGTAAVTDDYIGDSRSWDAIDDYNDCPSDSKIDDIFDGGGTISYWINPNTAGESSLGHVVGKRTTAATNGWNSMTLTPSGSNMNIRYQNIPTTGGQWVDTNKDIAASKWQLVTITYNDDSNANDPIIYVNGSSVGLTESVVPSTAYVSDAADNMCIGQLGNGAGVCTTTATFDGKIDEVRLNNIILSADWIKADWECQRGALDGNSCILLGSQGTEPPSAATFTLADDIAIQEDPALTYTINFTFNVADDIPVEDDNATASLAGTFTVSDDIAIEDSGGTTTFTVSDDIALDDNGVSLPAAVVTHRNAIAIYLNSPAPTRLGGLFSGLCDIANNYTMIGVFTNGTIACAKYQ